MSEWRPIETAPKDGTRIIGACGREVYICWWGNYWDFEERGKKKVWMSDQCTDFGGYETPTHWMPLPVPPGGEE